MVDITSLPRETLRMIFESLDSPSRSQDKSDLSHCTQICRLWYEIAIPVLYRRFSICITSPPAPDDHVRTYFTAKYLAEMEEIHVTVTTVDHPYTTQQECDDLIWYLGQITQMLSLTRNLRFAELDISAFTPADCSDGLWDELHPANDLLVTLVQTIVSKNPQLSLTLSRPDIMAETQVENASRPVFEGILREAREQFQSLNVGCRLSWFLQWIRENPQLREIYYTPTSWERHEMEEFWDVIQSCRSLDKLMLFGFDFPPIQKIPSRLVELILTHLDDTVSVSNALLQHLPNLRLLSLRLQKDGIDYDDDIEECIDGQRIVCRGLRKAWWTAATAPKNTVRVVSEACQWLESISPPRNVTDDDLVILSEKAVRLTEIWIMDCPDITATGIGSLRDLRSIKHLQLQRRLASFLSQDFVTDFLASSKSLLQITLVFDGTRDESVRRAELWSMIPGQSEYHEMLADVMSFQPSNLGDKVMFNIKLLRDYIVTNS